MNKNELISPKEAADMLKVSVNTIKRLLMKEKIKSVRIGRQIRIYKYSLENYICKNQCI